MPLEQHKDLVRRYFGEFASDGRLELAEQLFTPTFLQERPLPADVPPGPARARWIWSTWRAAFPDWRVEVVELVGEGDCLAARIVARGTHLGELARGALVTRVPPTGKRVELLATVWFHVEDGRIARIVETADFTALLQSLGISRVPEPASATG